MAYFSRQPLLLNVTSLVSEARNLMFYTFAHNLFWFVQLPPKKGEVEENSIQLKPDTRFHLNRCQEKGWKILLSFYLQQKSSLENQQFAFGWTFVKSS